MRTRIIRIGNSKGIRIPKALLEESGLGDEVEIGLCPEGLQISPAAGPRLGWAEEFKNMALAGDDVLPLDEATAIGPVWDEAEWQW